MIERLTAEQVDWYRRGAPLVRCTSAGVADACTSCFHATPHEPEVWDDESLGMCSTSHDWCREAGDDVVCVEVTDA